MRGTTQAGPTSTARWPWSRSLALAGEGETLQVEEILFAAVKERCGEMGIRPGTVMVCEGRHPDEVAIALPDGARVRIPRHYAWFVAVHPL